MEKKKKAIKAFKIVGSIIYILTTAFLIIMLSAVISDMKADKDLWELGGALSMAITLIASIAYIIPMVLGIIGVRFAKKLEMNGSRVFCTLMIFVPLVTACANFVTYLIMLK